MISNNSTLKRLPWLGMDCVQTGNYSNRQRCSQVRFWETLPLINAFASSMNRSVRIVGDSEKARSDFPVKCRSRPLGRETRDDEIWPTDQILPDGAAFM